MKQADIEIGAAYVVEARVNYPRVLMKGTVVEKDVAMPHGHRRHRGVAVRWEQTREGAGYSFPTGAEEAVLARRILRPWGPDDDDVEVERRDFEARVGACEDALRTVGVMSTREHMDAQHVRDRDARIAARQRGDEDWMAVEGEPLDRPHALVGYRVTMPLETLEFLLDQINNKKGKR